MRLPPTRAATGPVMTALVLVMLWTAGCGQSSPQTTTASRTGAPATATTPATSPTTSTATTTTPLPGTNRPAVAIGDKNYDEQFVLGELYRRALVAQGFSATLNRNIGISDVTLQALATKQLDLYPEYLDTWNRDLAGDHHSYPSVAAALSAGRRHAAARGLRLLDPTPFSDVNAVAVTPAYARANGLHSLSDLRAVGAAMTMGGPLQFQTSDPGLPALGQAYGFVPAQFTPLDVGAQLDALDRGTIQAAAVQSTDGQLQVGQYVLLADPEHVFGWGNVVPVVPARVLDAEGPVFLSTINAVSALLSIPVMRQLVADVQIAGQDPGTVARRFLQANGLVPPDPPGG